MWPAITIAVCLLVLLVIGAGVPLVRVYRAVQHLKSGDEGMRLWGARDLRFYGKYGLRPRAAIPLLIKGLGTTCFGTEYEFLEALANYGPAAKAAIPEILWYVRSGIGECAGHSNNANAAIRALAKMGEKAKAAVPLLLEVYRTTNAWTVKAGAAIALEKIDPEAAARMGDWRSAVAESLPQITDAHLEQVAQRLREDNDTNY
ncbi:MAG TPA: HEAT repeat domain-containing protein [Thermoguttaceae bacterium]|nr:HEAT repeat domain-containing protein [Thermoguttaceae bacterium]